jgi:hypothetical protein
VRFKDVNIKKLCLILPLAAIASATASAGQETKCGQDSMEVSSPVRISLYLSAEQQAERLASVRGWIWSHWHEHRAGQRIVTMFSVEGRESRSRIGISRDCSGVWRIAYRIDRYAGRTIQETNQFEVYDVERVQIPFDGNLDRQPTLAADKLVKPTEYRLVFRDRDAKILTQF